MARDRKLLVLVSLSVVTTIASIIFAWWLLAYHRDSLPSHAGGRFSTGETDTVIRTPEQAEAWRIAHGQGRSPTSEEQRKAHEELCRTSPPIDLCR